MKDPEVELVFVASSRFTQQQESRFPRHSSTVVEQRKTCDLWVQRERSEEFPARQNRYSHVKGDSLWSGLKHDLLAAPVVALHHARPVVGAQVLPRRSGLRLGRSR